MLGVPQYKYNDYLEFTVNGEVIGGLVKIIDAFGTFDQNVEPSYDVFSVERQCLYKHIPESMIENYIPSIKDAMLKDIAEVGMTVTFGRFVTSQCKRVHRPDSMDEEGDIMMPLMWDIFDIDEEEGTLTLMGRDIIDWDMMSGNSWSDSELRNYLNEELISWAFNEQERDIIVKAAVSTFNYDEYGKMSAQVTYDYLYPMSIYEALRSIHLNQDNYIKLIKSYANGAPYLEGEWSEGLRKEMVIYTTEGIDHDPKPYWLRDFNRDGPIMVNEKGGIELEDVDPEWDEIGIRLMVKVAYQPLPEFPFE